VAAVSRKREPQPLDAAADAPQPQAGLTVRDLARRYRVGEDKIRQWIRKGELVAINTAMHLSGRPRYIVTAEALAAFEKWRTTAPPLKARRRKRPEGIDFYPD
jgi:transposase